MTNEQRKAIELAKEFTKMDFSNKMGWTGYYDTELKELSDAIDTVLSLIKEQEKYIKDANDITEEMLEYLIPLIQGELPCTYENGIPVHFHLPKK